MVYFALVSGLRARVGDTGIVAEPTTQEVVEVSPFVMDVLRFATSGESTLSDATNELSRKYLLSSGKTGIMLLEAIHCLLNAGLIRLSESPMPNRKLFEGPAEAVGRVLISVTYRCNFRCVHCLQGAKDFVSPLELRTEEWFRLLREISDYGISFLHVTGGEPLLRKDTVDILEEAAEYAFPTRLYTNATLVNEELAERFSRIDNLCIQISLHGIDASSCDPFVGVRGAYEKILEAIRMLTNQGVHVSVATSFRDELIPRMNEFPPLLNEIGVKEWVPTLIMPMGCAFDNWRALRVSDERMRMFMDNLLRFCSIYKGTDFEIFSPFSTRILQGRKDVWDRSPKLTFSCDLYGQYVNIDPAGNVHPCDRLTTHSLGNLRHEPLKDILSKREEIARQKIANFERTKRLGIWHRCSRCSYRSLCGMGCPAILFQGRSLGEEEFDPIVCRMFRECFDILLKYSTSRTARVMRNTIEESAHAGVGN